MSNCLNVTSEMRIENLHRMLVLPFKKTSQTRSSQVERQPVNIIGGKAVPGPKDRSVKSQFGGSVTHVR